MRLVKKQRKKEGDRLRLGTDTEKNKQRKTKIEKDRWIEGSERQK